MICKECGRNIKSLGVASHRAMHYRKKIAAQDTKDETRHIHQQPQPKITPCICAKLEYCHNAGGKRCGSHQRCYTV
jgi:hypothetical protein